MKKQLSLLLIYPNLKAKRAVTVQKYFHIFIHMNFDKYYALCKQEKKLNWSKQ
jgi:hypothetical protein